MTANTAQGKIWVVGILIDYWNYTMHSPIWMLTTGIAHCAIPVGKNCWPKDKFAQFLEPSSHYPLEMRKIVLEASVGQECANLKRKVSLPFLDRAMQPR